EARARRRPAGGRRLTRPLLRSRLVPICVVSREEGSRKGRRRIAALLPHRPACLRATSWSVCATLLALAEAPQAHHDPQEHGAAPRPGQALRWRSGRRSLRPAAVAPAWTGPPAPVLLRVASL